MNEILQKRIEEAARKEREQCREDNNEIWRDRPTYNDIEISFKNGATFSLQNQWISVEEALPEIVDGYRSARVIVRSKYNSYDVAKWDEYYKDWIRPDYVVVNVTHWMPIPSLEGGEK